MKSYDSLLLNLSKGKNRIADDINNIKKSKEQPNKILQDLNIHVNQQSLQSLQALQAGETSGVKLIDTIEAKYNNYKVLFESFNKIKNSPNNDSLEEINKHVKINMTDILNDINKLTEIYKKYEYFFKNINDVNKQINSDKYIEITYDNIEITNCDLKKTYDEDCKKYKYLINLKNINLKTIRKINNNMCHISFEIIKDGAKKRLIVEYNPNIDVSPCTIISVIK